MSRSEIVEQSFLWSLAAGLAWVPFWYGSNDWFAWGANAVIFPGLAGLYELSLLVRGKPHPYSLRYLLAPALLFACAALWAAAQTVPMSNLGWPANPIWGVAADALDHTVAGSISVNRDATIVALMRLVTAASCFWLALQLCRDPNRANNLLTAIAGIVVLYAVYGLIAMSFGQLPLLRFMMPTDKLTSTFINPNSFATYASIGLIILAALTLRFYGEGMRKAAGSSRMQLAFFIERMGGRGAALLAGGFTVFVAILLTGSRGGVASALLGLAILALNASRRRASAKTPQLLIVLVTAFVIVTIVAFGDTVGSKLREGGVYDQSRLSVYGLTLRSILNQPWLGYGYGTFANVFPIYRDRSVDVTGTWSQAHDTYLEAFQGLGLIFGSMLVASLVLIVLKCQKGISNRRYETTASNVAVSASCLIAAHALVDFSIQMQAVAITLMAVLGVGTAQSASSKVALED